MTNRIIDHDRLGVYRLSIDDKSYGELKRIVSMLTRLLARGDAAREDSTAQNADVEYEYEIQTDT